MSTVDPSSARRVVNQFLMAAREGDIPGLIAVLHPDATRTADAQALPVGAPLELRGAEAVATGTRAFRERARNARVVSIDGRPGIVVESDQQVVAALVFAFAGPRILRYDVVADPQRLARLRVEE